MKWHLIENCTSRRERLIRRGAGIGQSLTVAGMEPASWWHRFSRRHHSESGWDQTLRCQNFASTWEASPARLAAWRQPAV